MTALESPGKARTRPEADQVAEIDAGEQDAANGDPQQAADQQSEQDAADSPQANEQLEPAGTEPQEGQAPERADGERSCSQRELEAARKFGLDDQDVAALVALGDSGRQLVGRLVKVDSDLGRRYSRIGRAERAQGRDSSPAGDGAAVVGRPADRGDDEWAGMAQQLQRLREQVAELVQDLQQNRTGQQSEAAERFFAALDPEVYTEFGSGKSEELSADSPELRRRQELLTKAAEIRRGYELVHGEPLDTDESLRQALPIVAAEAQSQSEQRRLSRQLQRRSRQRISRPTQRRGGESYESAAEQTGRALAEWERTRGIKFFTD